jgi:type IX secretion system PorP/SprF family membrane protein
MKKRMTTFRLSGAWIACVVLIFTQQLRAQDFHLTHYDAAKIYLNPAMTGMFDGRFRIHANYRNQWTAVASRPFQTAAIAWDKPIRRYGVGVQLMNNRAGIGNFNVLNLTASAAYDLQLDDANEHHVAFGMNAGFTQKSVNFGKLTWNNQYTMANGGSFDQSMPSGELFAGNEQQYLLDVSAGALYYFAREKSRFNPFVGFSAFHLNRPNESFFGMTTRWPIRYVLHAGGRVGINERLTLQPRFLSMWQLNDREMVIGLLANIYLPNSDSYLIAGPTFRNRDAAIIELGLKHGEYTYRISYDINVSTLKPASNNRGGIEFSVVYVAKRKSPVVPPNCPRL